MNNKKVAAELVKIAKNCIVTNLNKKIAYSTLDEKIARLEKCVDLTEKTSLVYEWVKTGKVNKREYVTLLQNVFKTGGKW